MPSPDHPFPILLATMACFVAAFPLARFFFDDFDTFKEEAGLSRDWEQTLWSLGFIPPNPLLYVKLVGFVGILAIVFLAVYSLGVKVAASAS